MSTSKKRKNPGDPEDDFRLILNELENYHSSAVDDGLGLTPLSIGVQNVISKVESLLGEPQSLRFSDGDDNVLEKFNIREKGTLLLRDSAVDAMTASRTVGSDKLWSDDCMYKHLLFLDSTYTIHSEASSRMVIDTFFFRASSMVSSPQKVVVMLEKRVPEAQPRLSKSDTISGIIDYMAIVATPTLAGRYLRRPKQLTQSLGKKIIAFFVAEAKSTGEQLFFEHLPQVLLQLVACAKHLGKSHIRGALTTGFEWYFIAMDLDADGDGAQYWVSESIGWKFERDPNSKERVIRSPDTPSLIVGILSSWIPQGFVEFEDDEWFYREE